MKKRLLCFAFLIVIQLGFTQNNFLWQGYFSYNTIKDVSNSPIAIFAAAENALFSKNIKTGQLKTTNTLDGLSGETITSLYYSVVSNKTLVGYENGLMIVINEADGSMLKVVDISNNNQLAANRKRINHFMEYKGIVYVSCNFGIVQFNLDKEFFSDTYFIGDNGIEINVTQTTVHEGFIYASTEFGIRRADVTSTSLRDFNKWTTTNSGSWSSIETFDKELFAIDKIGNIYEYNGADTFEASDLQLNGVAVDMRTSENYLLVTTPKSVFIFDKEMKKVQIDNDKSAPTFTCATSIGNTIYIGTKENGMWNTTIKSEDWNTSIPVSSTSVSSTFKNNTPSGPSRNNSFAIQTTSTSLWAVYGDYDLYYVPNQVQPYGLSKYSETGWLNISDAEVLGARCLVRITVNPTNENEVYASSFFYGLLKIVNDKPVYLYNHINSGLETLTFEGPNVISVRINGAAFDKSGKLWVTNSLVKNGLKSMSPSGNWESYPMDKIVVDINKNNFCRLAIDKNGTKWITTNESGLIGFNEKNAVFKNITVGTDTGNLPTTDVRVAAPDNNNQLWIGTTKGLRVLSNVSSYFSEKQMTANPIIILEDGLAQELLYEQFITDIVVDGANNKWVGTADSGVFLLSSNGQETKYHFTKDNSPLPSNTINDIDINNSTGEVFIATTKGLISFKGTATSANEDLNSVYVYPNPVRPEFEGTVKIAGLLDNATVKITDIEGNLVYETTSEGGTIEWDTTAFGKYKVASGVYMIFISAQDGIETKVKKVMIIR